MGVLNECLAKPHVFEHKGRKYKVSLINQDIKLKWEQAMFQRAKDAALGMRDLMTPADYRAHLKQLNDDYISGNYGMDSVMGMKAMQTPQGGLLLVSLLFGVDSTEAICLISERQADVIALLQVIMHESFPGLVGGEGGGSPNGESKSGGARTEGDVCHVA